MDKTAKSVILANDCIYVGLLCCMSVVGQGWYEKKADCSDRTKTL